MNNKVSLDDAINQLVKTMQSRMYSPDTRYRAKQAIADLRNYRKLISSNLSDEQVLEAYVAARRKRCTLKNDEKLRRIQLMIANRLLSICRGQPIQWRSQWFPMDALLSEYYDGVLKKVMELANQNYSGSSITAVRSNAYHLFIWLQDEKGIGTLRVFSKTNLIDYLSLAASKSTYSGICSVRWALKTILRFLNQLGYIDSDFEEVFYLSPRVTKRLLPPANIDEVTALLKSIDRSTMQGKRNFAIIMLGLTTGLRRSDVANLSLTSVDWKEGKINVIQQKTKKPISCILTQDTAEAIMDYIKNGRPHKVKTDKLFVGLKAPYNPMTSNGIGKMYQESIKKVAKKPFELRTKTFHSLRRLYAKRMIEGGASLFMASKSLGHTTYHAASPYIYYDTAALRCCGLDLSRTYCAKENSNEK